MTSLYTLGRGNTMWFSTKLNNPMSCLLSDMIQRTCLITSFKCFIQPKQVMRDLISQPQDLKLFPNLDRTMKKRKKKQEKRNSASFLISWSRENNLKVVLSKHDLKIRWLWTENHLSCEKVHKPFQISCKPSVPCEQVCKPFESGESLAIVFITAIPNGNNDFLTNKW